MGMAKEALCYCCCCCFWLLAVPAIIIGLTVLACVGTKSCTVPFRASVDEATLARLSSLAVPGSNNGSTRPPPAVSLSLAYDLAIVVALRRNTKVAGARRAAPLDAELRFLGQPLACARLAGAEWEAVGGRRPRAGEPGKMVYRLAWNGETNATLALGPGKAAAFAAESAAGVFELELVVAGEFKYTAHFRLSRWCRIRLTCPLRLSVSTAAAPAPFERVECSSSS